MPKTSINDMFKGVDKSWIKIMTSKTMLPHLSKVLGQVTKLQNVTPPLVDVFNMLRYTPYGKVKVIIVGQDPYPTRGHAHGLSFSSLSDKIPQSLNNIYKCLLKNKLIDSKPVTSDLTSWAQQGVLLLNTALTTEIGKPNAHKNMWKDVTDELIRVISNDNDCWAGDSVIFMLWGNAAKDKKKLINDECVIYEWIHPSPLAQHVPDHKKFISCPHFSDTNMVLTDYLDVSPINWGSMIATPNVTPDVTPLNVAHVITPDVTPLNATHVVYTDGACSNNGKQAFAKAGYAVYFAQGSWANRVVFGRVAPKNVNNKMLHGTNQRAEGLAIIRALELVIADNGNIHIITDSMFWIRMINDWMPGWIRKGIDFNTKANSDLTVRLNLLVNQIKSLKITHVPSHGKKSAPAEHVLGNSVADEYAVKARHLIHFNEVDEVKC